MALSIAEQLLYSTVRLTRFQAGVEVGAGTGFFYNVPFPDGRTAPVIITNKHVMAGIDRIDIHCHQAKPNTLGEPSGQFLHLRLSINSIVQHANADVDLCALPIAGLIDQCANAGTPILFVHLNKTSIPNDADWEYFDAIEEVTMIGCPNGLYDTVNKLPLARRGITASPLSKRYEGKPIFLVDIACFPGSSGSPIFLFNANGYVDRKTNEYRVGGVRVLLVGVLFAGPTITNTGQVILTQQFQVNSMMHLGYAIRASEILGLEHQILNAYSQTGTHT